VEKNQKKYQSSIKSLFSANEGNTQDIFCDLDLDNLEFYSATYVGYRAKTHSHEEYTLGIVDAGQRMYTNNGKQEIARSGSLLLINPNTPHGGDPIDDKLWCCRAFYPGYDIFSKYFGFDGLEKPYPTFPNFVVQDKEVYNRFDAFFTLVKTSQFSLEKQTAFVDLLEILIKRFSSVGPQMENTQIPDNATIKVLKTFMKENYARKLNLEELSNVAGVHPNYLIKMFQRKTGFTPHNYLMDFRLKVAKDKLRVGKAPADVAIEVGFFDQSHMNNYFKTILGMTPKQYQNACNK